MPVNHIEYLNDLFDELVECESRIPALSCSDARKQLNITTHPVIAYYSNNKPHRNTNVYALSTLDNSNQVANSVHLRNEVQIAAKALRLVQCLNDLQENLYF